MEQWTDSTHGAGPADPDDDVELQTETETTTAVEDPWCVVIHDDPVNTCEYVTFVLRKVLQVSAVQAEAFMWTAHNQGRAVVRRCGRSEASQVVVALATYAIQAGIER